MRCTVMVCVYAACASASLIQSSLTESLSIVEASADYEAFLGLLGQKIILKNWTGYNGGLDTTSKFRIGIT